MKILKTQVLRGPNYWSNYRKHLIVMKLDLGIYEELPTNLLGNFNQRLLGYLPSLYSHRCSEGVEGGLKIRLEEGTWLGHVIEHVALELQCLAGIDCGFGRTYGTKEYGIYYVIFAYKTANAGLYAGEAAVKFITALAEGNDYPIQEKIAHLKEIYKKESLGPSTQAIVDEAIRRKIPYTCLHDSSLITLGHGCNQKKIWAAVTSKTSSIAVDIASDKELTKQILSTHCLPTPKGLTVKTKEELTKAIEELGFPLVIKPLNGNHGKGVTTNITTSQKALFGFEQAQKISANMIIERYITGNDYRFLVINYKVVAVAKRTPAMIVGDGISSIEELIQQANQDPNRGEAHEKILTTIKIDDSTFSILRQNNLNLASVLSLGQVLYLKEAANLSSGGTATDVTDEVHPLNLFLAERAARLIGLDICGIDVVAKDIRQPLGEHHGAIIEVNAGPGLRMHLAPNEGQPRNVAEPLMNMLYPSAAAARIPLIAVTGTNGKTTVVRLISYIARHVGYTTGATTTEGIYINNKMIIEGDCSGPASAEMVLQSPEVDFAVLECARGGILRSGLGFDECNISVITNISEDHLGLEDIHTIEDLADVKSVVARSTNKSGYSILNADDNLTYSIKKDLECNIALFSMFESPRIRKHCDGGGLAAYIADGQVMIRRGDERYCLCRVNDVPISFQGAATCMILNMLSAVLAAVISNFSYDKIKEALHQFQPTPENLPGRMNLFRFPQCDVMIDYAHNEGALCEIKNYLETIECETKIGIIGVPGDRRDEDIEKLGYHSASMFDEIIIRHDKDGRGRNNTNITQHLCAGIARSGFKPAVKIISDEINAIECVLERSHSDTFVFCAVEDVFGVTSLLKKKEKQYNKINEVYNDAQG
ncbi:MAG: cyanophycin synthetase [Legionella sp.]|uniref:cyanophycin synthetase n=1 Tax=Legionella sp. TaxID=459 RepID=UPI0039E5602F